jgi:protein-S-isoprenylcysteine O-methyltransferase Ste14
MSADRAVGVKQRQPRKEESALSRLAAILFAIAAYAIFFATFLYLIVFVGDFTFAELTVDNGPGGGPVAAAFIDLGLIALFGLQHSVMARQGFKRWWMKIVPPAIERSVYVLAASIVLMVLFIMWRPIDAIVWSINPIPHPAITELIWAAFWIGWLTVLVSTFLINHLELFGLQQAWFHLSGHEIEPPVLRQPLLYKYVRHPLYLGFFFAFWATPEMTVGHLLLAAGMSVYMLVGIRYEERDLVRLFGRDYELYRERAGMLLPRFRRKPAS